MDLRDVRLEISVIRLPLGIIDKWDVLEDPSDV